jgi:F0F1-type ATP synthase delta subunit
MKIIISNHYITINKIIIKWYNKVNKKKQQMIVIEITAALNLKQCFIYYQY